MLMAENILAQSRNMIYIDTYELEDDGLHSIPKFEGILESDLVPVSMWLESICQNGEIFIRETMKQAGKVILTNVQELSYIALLKKETKNISYKMKQNCLMNHYLKSEITVINEGKPLFTCNCTHYFEIK